MLEGVGGIKGKLSTTLQFGGKYFIISIIACITGLDLAFSKAEELIVIDTDHPSYRAFQNE